MKRAIDGGQMMNWQPIETAPKDGQSFRVPEQAGYTHCFWQDGYWWWHTVHGSDDSDYAVGPTPPGWLPATPIGVVTPNA